MGMFDRVAFEYNCPKCGKVLNDFQTKTAWGSANMMQIVKPEVCQSFYTKCDCDTWVEFRMKDGGIPAIAGFHLEHYDLIIEDLNVLDDNVEN